MQIVYHANRRSPSRNAGIDFSPSASNTALTAPRGGIGVFSARDLEVEYQNEEQGMAETQEAAANTGGENRVAFLDLGTNSVRLLLVRFNLDQSFTVLSEQKETVRLGEGEFQTKELQPAAVRRTTLVCGQFAEMARSQGAREIVAVATSATREARNRVAFLRHLRQHAGVEVRVISGKEEARLIYLGVSSGTNLGNQLTLFIDIGGGSTETIVGDQQQYRYLDSLAMGAIRLSSEFFKPQDQGPVSKSKYQQLQKLVQRNSVRTLERLREYPLEQAVGSSGTIMNLADVAVRLAKNRPFQKDEMVSREELRSAVQHLCELSVEGRRSVPGLNPDRADIIIGGAAILETLLDAVKLPGIYVSDRGLREGLPVDYLSRHVPGELLEQSSFRERSVLELGRRCGFDEQHARHVARLAWQLFDSAKAAGLHDMGSWERELLEHAALLHDVGTFLSYNQHRLHSYYFVRHADLLGFDQTEISIIAATVMFHHHAFPHMRHLQIAELEKQPRKVVRMLCVLLRLAESLDRSHRGPVNRADFHPGDKKRIRLEVLARQDCLLELREVRRHERAFQKVFGVQLEIVQRTAPRAE